MAFLPSIPQSTDQLSVSQGNILNNFTILGAIAGNANPASASINATAGFNWIDLPMQGATPPAGASFPSGDVGLYSFVNSSSTVNELYLNKTNASGVVQIPATASILGASTPSSNSAGWTYLPSGILLKFGSATTGGGGTGTFTFAALNPGSPAFTATLTMLLTPINSGAGDANSAVILVSFTNLGFVAYGSFRASSPSGKAVNFQYLAIGY